MKYSSVIAPSLRRLRFGASLIVLVSVIALHAGPEHSIGKSGGCIGNVVVTEGRAMGLMQRVEVDQAADQIHPQSHRLRTWEVGSTVNPFHFLSLEGHCLTTLRHELCRPLVQHLTLDIGRYGADSWQHHYPFLIFTPRRFRASAHSKILIVREGNARIAYGVDKWVQDMQTGNMKSWRFAAILRQYTGMKWHPLSRFLWHLNSGYPQPRTLARGECISGNPVRLPHLAYLVAGRVYINKQRDKGGEADNESEDFDDEPSNFQTAVLFAAGSIAVTIGWGLVRFGKTGRWQALGGLLVILTFLSVPGFFMYYYWHSASHD